VVLHTKPYPGSFSIAGKILYKKKGFSFRLRSRSANLYRRRSFHITGPKGENCPFCPDGRPGDKGERGDFGMPGLPGRRGDSGLVGRDGQKGYMGRRGRPGNKGLSVSGVYVGDL